MSNAFTRRGFAIATAATAMLFATAPHAFADAMTLTDIVGREATLPDAPSRIILGEGQIKYAIANLVTDDPFENIVGWNVNLILYDEDALRSFEVAFVEDTAHMVSFSSPYAGNFSIEAVLENEADLLIFNFGNLFKAREAGLIEKLDEAGVPVLFVEFC